METESQGSPNGGQKGVKVSFICIGCQKKLHATYFKEPTFIKCECGQYYMGYADTVTWPLPKLE